MEIRVDVSQHEWRKAWQALLEQLRRQGKLR